MAQFCEQHLTVGGKTKRSELYRHYRQFCDHENVTPERNAVFYSALEARGMRPTKTRGTRCFGCTFTFDK